MGLSFYESSSIDSSNGENMLDEIFELVGRIESEGLREKVNLFLKNPPSDVDAPALPLEVCPAGAFQHHSYDGGLLQHTLGVTKLSLTLSDLVESLYGGTVERDTVLAGAILHDVMKCYCYEERGEGGYRTSDFGGKVDHLTLMVGEMMKRKFPLEVVHVVASHHGDVGPTRPKTVEALIVSVADLADSDLNGKLLRAAEYLLKRTGTYRPKLSSSKEALDVVTTKDREGWEGLRKLSDES
jgi:7,8-dihydroneopterin 2',3'-cyclic phosphate phosphodiesterase